MRVNAKGEGGFHMVHKCVGGHMMYKCEGGGGTIWLINVKRR